MLLHYKAVTVFIIALLLYAAAGIFKANAIEKNIAAPINRNDVSLNISVIKKWKMPDVLKEISGITYIDNDHLACIQDNKGVIFIYNIKADSVERIIPFWGHGDFEGIALAGNTMYAVRSNGLLYAVSNYKSRTPTIKEYPTGLTVKQNVEGLCYDKKQQRLLLAIKSNELYTADYKGIYAFELQRKIFIKEPVIKIDLHDPAWNTISWEQKIRPSDIAVHPLTGDIYVIDGEDPKLLILSAAGKIKSLQRLKKKWFRLPEGITFSKNGDLFISNEGGLIEKGNIVKVVVTL